MKFRFVLVAVLVMTAPAAVRAADDAPPPPATPPAPATAVEPVEPVEPADPSEPPRPTADKWNTEVALTYYYDTREYGTLNILTSASRLPLGLTFWGFTDFHSDQENRSGAADFTRYFMEYRLSRHLEPRWVLGIEGLGVMVEYNDFNGPDNNLARFGPYYKMQFQLPWNRTARLQWRVFPYETDGAGWQISLSYFVPFTERVSLTGFADINFIENGTDRWVIEPQLNYMLDEHFSVVVELRYNEFEEAAPDLHGFGVAGGLQVTF